MLIENDRTWLSKYLLIHLNEVLYMPIRLSGSPLLILNPLNLYQNSHYLQK